MGCRGQTKQNRTTDNEGGGVGGVVVDQNIILSYSPIGGQEGELCVLHGVGCKNQSRQKIKKGGVMVHVAQDQAVKRG